MTSKMFKIDGITDEPIQNFQTKIADIPESIKITLRYMPSVYSWFLDLEYDSKVCNNIRLNLSSNIIRGFKNVLPFGIAVQNSSQSDGLPPISIDDFSTGRTEIFVLNSEMVEEIEGLLYE